MNLPEPLRSLPDSTPCYVPGVGEVTLGQVRRTEEKPALEDSWEATLRMYARKATDHYTAKGTWPENGAGRLEGKESTA